MLMYNENDSRILKDYKQLKDYFRNKDGLKWVNKEVEMIKDNFAEKKTKEQKQTQDTMGKDIINHKQNIKSLKDRKTDILKKELDIISKDIPLSNEFIDIKDKIEIYEENLFIEKSETKNKSNLLYEIFSKIANNKIIDMFLYPKTVMQWSIKIIIYISSIIFIKSIIFLIIIFFETYYKMRTKRIEYINTIIDKRNKENNMLEKEIYTEVLRLEDDIIKYRANIDIESEIEEMNIEIRDISQRLNELEKNQKTRLIEINYRINRELQMSLDGALKKKESLERKDIELGLAYRTIRKNYLNIDKNANIEEILVELKTYLDSGKAADDTTAINMYKQRLKEEKEDVLNEIKRKEELKRYKEMIKLEEKEVERERIEMEEQAELERKRLEKESKERACKILLKEEEEKIYKLEKDIKKLDKKMSNRSINEYEKQEIKEEREYLNQYRLKLIKNKSTF